MPRQLRGSHQRSARAPPSTCPQAPALPIEDTLQEQAHVRTKPAGAARAGSERSAAGRQGGTSVSRVPSSARPGRQALAMGTTAQLSTRMACHRSSAVLAERMASRVASPTSGTARFSASVARPSCPSTPAINKVSQDTLCCTT